MERSRLRLASSGGDACRQGIGSSTIIYFPLYLHCSTTPIPNSSAIFLFCQSFLLILRTLALKLDLAPDAHNFQLSLLPPKRQLRMSKTTARSMALPPPLSEHPMSTSAGRSMSRRSLGSVATAEGELDAMRVASLRKILHLHLSRLALGALSTLPSPIPKVASINLDLQALRL